MPLPERLTTDQHRRLVAIRDAMDKVDEMICDLPSPAEPKGRYYEAWGRLSQLHGAWDDPRTAIQTAIGL